MELVIKKVVVGQIETNCYVVSRGNTCFIVDPGGDSTKIKDAVGIMKPQFILLTHGHFDHVLALESMTMLFPKIDVYVGADDEYLLAHLSEQGNFVGQKFKDIHVRVKAVKEGDVIRFTSDKIKVIETPGHTMGSVCYRLGDNLFSGDTLFFHTVGRTDLPTSNEELMKKSLGKLAKLPVDLRVLPGHMKETTILEEKTFGFLA
jgi:glyoxylase-like metal-dependent hydrolase (beta-lactamase superfamily II)